MRKIMALFIAIILCCNIPNYLNAQYLMGALVGKIKNDMSGDMVVNAEVNIEIEGAQLKNGLTDEEGNFRIYNLNEGIYEVLVRAIGFAPMRITGVPIEALKNTSLNLKFYNESYSYDTLVISYSELYPTNVSKRKPRKPLKRRKKQHRAERKLKKAARELDIE